MAFIGENTTVLDKAICNLSPSPLYTYSLANQHTLYLHLFDVFPLLHLAHGSWERL